MPTEMVDILFFSRIALFVTQTDVPYVIQLRLLTHKKVKLDISQAHVEKSASLLI